MVSSQRLVHISFKNNAYLMIYALLETREADLSIISDFISINFLSVEIFVKHCTVSKHCNSFVSHCKVQNYWENHIECL